MFPLKYLLLYSISNKYRAIVNSVGASWLNNARRMSDKIYFNTCTNPLVHANVFYFCAEYFYATHRY